MATLSRSAQRQSSTTSCIVKSSNFHPDLSNRGLRSGRYLLPKRKLPSKLNASYRADRSPYRQQLDSGPCNIKYKEIIESRPPLRLDLSTPGPWAYSPHNTKPLNETNAPSYTMRPKCWSEKDSGGRTSWSKTWYQSPEVWTTKANFNQENVWPSPSSYNDKLKIGGEHQSTHNRSPAYTMGHRKMALIRAGTEKEPSPASYNKNLADNIIYHRAPTVIHSCRPTKADNWVDKNATPGPGAYSPSMSGVKKHQPAFSISRASREGLQPLLGPFASS